MAITQRELKDHFGFKCVSSIQNVHGRLCFEPKTYEDENAGWVYLWIKVNDKVPSRQFSACYVGKAGKTLKARWSQHAGGFNSAKGRGSCLAKQIRAYLSSSKNNEIHVYARHSPKCKVLGETVSKCDIEEHAMIQKLGGKKGGLWNKTMREN